MDFSLLVGSLSTQPQQYREDQSLLQQQQQQQQDIQDLLIPILLTALIVLVTTGVFYVFYPALSIQWNEPSVTKEQWGPNRGKGTLLSNDVRSVRPFVWMYCKFKATIEYRFLSSNPVSYLSLSALDSFCVLLLLLQSFWFG